MLYNQEIYTQIQALPKVQLHDHLDGGLRPQTLIDLAQEFKVELPCYDAYELGKWFYETGLKCELPEFVRMFDITCSVMVTYEAIKRVAYEFVHDMALDNVIYAEVRFCPGLFLDTRLNYQEIINAVADGLLCGKEDFGVESGILICLLRQYSIDFNYDLAKLAVDNIGGSVCGVDFAGIDKGHPLKVHDKSLALLKTHNIPLTIHAGESDGIASIAEAIEYGALRIGHAAQIFHDEDHPLFNFVVSELKARNIHLELNIASNISTGLTKGYLDHPTKRLYDEGFNVSINTDDRLMLNNTLSLEYAKALYAYGYSVNDVKTMVRNAANAAFTSNGVWQQILSKLA